MHHAVHALRQRLHALEAVIALGLADVCALEVRHQGRPSVVRLTSD